jgi:galactonate dehydratase
MKITDLKPFTARLGGGRNQILVKVETDEGIDGWGEAGLFTRELAVQGVVRHYREFLIGRDPMQRGRIWQELYRSQYFEGGLVTSAAIAAVDIALHDIAGKHLGVPVYDLLGGRQRDYVQLFATAGGADVAEALDEAKRLAAEGWSAIRLGVLEPPADDPSIFEPRRSLALNAEVLVRAREELGADAVIGIDYHHRLSVAEAASFCQLLPPGTIDFLEEPIRAQTPGAYEALRRMTSVPFAIGEEFSSKWEFRPYVERDILSFARLDVCNVGGLTEAMKVAGWCEAHYVDLMPHNPLGPICTAASAHLASAVPNHAWLEIFDTAPGTQGHFYDRDIYPVQPEIVGDRLYLGDRPGLGIEVDEEALDEALRFAEFPHLRREDGSVTNW